MSNRQGDHYHPKIGDKGRHPVVGEMQSHRQSQVNSFDKMRLYNRPNQIDNPLDFAIILAGVEKMSQSKLPSSVRPRLDATTFFGSSSPKICIAN